MHTKFDIYVLLVLFYIWMQFSGPSSKMAVITENINFFLEGQNCFFFF